MVSSIGMVHGRFQPVHLEHLDYIAWGLSLCEHLIIGITNPDRSDFKEEHLSLHRHLVEANPFTFFQRSEMIRQCLLDAGGDLAHVSITPFHLHDPSSWAYYLPPPQITTQYVRLFSNWEEQKAALFRAHGFEVVVDREARKNMSGSCVRDLVRSGEAWQSLVPPGTARVIKKFQAGHL